MKELNNLTNKIIASGRIVSINEKNGKCYVTVASKNGRDVYPKFMCDKESLSELSAHARIRVEGHVESQAKKNKDVDKWFMTQRFVADSIVPEVTMTEQVFGVKGKFFPSPEVNIYIAGVITKITEEDEWYRYTIKIDDGIHKPSTVRTSMRKLDRHPDITEGDNICAICSVATPKKENEGKIYFFEDILISDLVKLKEPLDIHNLTKNTIE